MWTVCKGTFVHTSMIGSLPFNPTRILVLVSMTSRSFPRISAGTGIVTSASEIVCVHLYGSVACSFASFSLCSRSRRSRSAREGSTSVSGGDGDIVIIPLSQILSLSYTQPQYPNVSSLLVCSFHVAGSFFFFFFLIACGASCCWLRKHL